MLTKSTPTVQESKETNIVFNSKTTSKNQIATENKKDSSEEGNEGYSYVSGQANLKPKVGFFKHSFLVLLTFSGARAQKK